MSILSELGNDHPSENRKTRWSRLRREAGLCGACSRPRSTYKGLCDACMDRQRIRMRSRRGFNRELPPFPTPNQVRYSSLYLLSEAALLLLPRPFISKVIFPANETCWLWTGRTVINPRYKNGREGKEYGHYTWKARRDDGGWITQGQTAHKLAYETIVGSVPEGLDLDHLCDNKLCVNPKHLDPVTRQINMLRCYERRRSM